MADFLWNDLNRKKKCGNLEEKKKSQRGKKSRGHEEKVRDQKLRRGRRIRAQQGEERMSLKGQKETDTSTNEKKGSVRRQRMKD